MTFIVKVDDILEQNICDIANIPFEYSISFLERLKAEEPGKIYFYTEEAFVAFLNDRKPSRIILNCSLMREFKLIVDNLSDTLLSLRLVPHPKKNCKLSLIENLVNLEVVSIYKNYIVDKLWDVTKNKKLKCFEVAGCNKITDFTRFQDTDVEELRFYSAPPGYITHKKLVVDHFAFVTRCRNLKRLYLDIEQDRLGAFYLKTFASMQNLEVLMIERGFFTFKQFAWLASRLPNVKSGFEPCRPTGNEGEYTIIGKSRPYLIRRITTCERQTKEFEKLKEHYATSGEDTPYDREY